MLLLVHYRDSGQEVVVNGSDSTYHHEDGWIMFSYKPICWILEVVVLSYENIVSHSAGSFLMEFLLTVVCYALVMIQFLHFPVV